MKSSEDYVSWSSNIISMEVIKENQHTLELDIIFWSERHLKKIFIGLVRESQLILFPNLWAVTHYWAVASWPLGCVSGWQWTRAGAHAHPLVPVLAEL